MADSRPIAAAGGPDADDRTAPPPRVHDRVAALLAAAGSRVPQARGGAVLAMAEAADPGNPPRVDHAGGGCGGGRRIRLDGDAVALTDGVRPTHLLVRAVGPDGAGVLVLVERGERGIEPWPRDGAISGEVAFRSARLDAAGVISGEIRDGEGSDRR